MQFCLPNPRVGHPHVASRNVEKLMAEGFSLLMLAPFEPYDTVHKTKEIGGRQSLPAQVETAAY